jgi:hypothetical protein
VGKKRGPRRLRFELEAFGGRGKNDFTGSKDLEDLIAVVDGRAELVKLLSIREFTDALPGHVQPDAASQERVGTIISQLEEIASL